MFLLAICRKMYGLCIIIIIIIIFFHKCNHRYHEDVEVVT